MFFVCNPFLGDLALVLYASRGCSCRMSSPLHKRASRWCHNSIPDCLLQSHVSFSYLFSMYMWELFRPSTYRSVGMVSCKSSVTIIVLRISYVCPPLSFPCHILCHMDPPMDTSSLWRRLTMREIVDILPHHTFSSKEERHWAKLEAAVMQLPAHQQALLERAAVTKLYCLNTSGVEEVDRGPISRTPAKALAKANCYVPLLLTTIWFEVNGHVELLTDPHGAITYLCLRLADWNQILVVVVLGFLPIPNTVAISCGLGVVLYKVYL